MASGQPPALPPPNPKPVTVDSDITTIPGFLQAENCSDIYEKFFLCIKSGHQFRTYHRTGEYEYCPPYWTDMFTCLRAKITPGEEKKAALMTSTTIYQQKLEADALKVPWWIPKEKPTWE